MPLPSTKQQNLLFLVTTEKILKMQVLPSPHSTGRWTQFWLKFKTAKLIISSHNRKDPENASPSKSTFNRKMDSIL